MVKLQEIKRTPKDNGEIRKSAFFVTIPLNYVLGFGWNTGDNLEWSILGKDRLRLIKVDKKSPPRNDRGDL